MTSQSPLFVVIWEFRVRPEAQAGFEATYGPQGAWAQLFSRDPAYVRTELERDLRSPGRYFTLDYWASEKSYEDFRRRFEAEYNAIDADCESLTEREALIGRFEIVV